MSLLYGRAWTLDIVPPGKTTGARYGNVGADPSDVRLTFALERTLGSNANKGKFALYNLTPDNRNAIVQGTNVFLRAGYEETIGIVFQGFVRKVESALDGPDVITTIECGDGEPFITYGYLNFTFAKPVTLAEILDYVCTKLSVQIGGQAYQAAGKFIQGIPRKSYSRYVLHGKTKHVLDTLLHPLGLMWSIQCGTLLVQSTKGVIRLQATSLSSSTGLVDVPTRTSMGVKCTTLLNPNIVPGSAINISGLHAATNGNFRCIKCTYKGDTEGADWTVEVEGAELLGPLAPVPVAQGKKGAIAGIDVADDVDAEELEDAE